jgi:integrase
MQLATSSLARQSPDLEDLIEKARSYIHAAKVPATQEGKAPLLTSDIRRIVASCPETLSGLRDRALLLVGFASAFRRSELAAIDLAHLSFTKDGLVIDLRRSKTDQEGSGRKVGIPFGTDDATRPVRARIGHYLPELLSRGQPRWQALPPRPP